MIEISLSLPLYPSKPIQLTQYPKSISGAECITRALSTSQGKSLLILNTVRLKSLPCGHTLRPHQSGKHVSNNARIQSYVRPSFVSDGPFCRPVARSSVFVLCEHSRGNRFGLTKISAYFGSRVSCFGL